MKTFLLSFAGALAALALFFIGGTLAVAGLVGVATAADPQPDSIVLTLDLRSDYADQAPATGLAAFSGAIGFTDVLTRIDAAERDDAVQGLFIRASETGIGSARAEELRDALIEFRETGKFVIAHTQGSFVAAGPSSYRSISAADEIWIQPATDLVVTGVAFDTEFYKGLLDRLSVTAEIEALHEYKNAPNSFKNEDYTEPHREALLALANSVWAVSLDDIAADRGIPVAELRQVLEAGPIPAEQAIELNLANELGWPEDALDAAESRIEGASLLDIASYTPPVAPARAPMIAIVGGEGPILPGNGDDDLFADTAGFGADRVARALLDAGDDERVQAVVFRVDSPGGLASAADQIWRAVERVQDGGTPVVVSMGPTAASGGYYVSAGADFILASDSTVTGSIGIFGGKLAIGEGLERIGINIRTIRVGGEFTDAFGAYRFTDTQRDTVRQSLQRGYDRFLEIVGEGRGMSYDEVHERARGRVWSGRDAADQGLVDGLGGFLDAIEKARELAGIAPEDEVRLVYYPQRRTGFDALEEFFGASSDTAEGAALLGELARNGELRALLSELEAARSGDLQARSPRLIEH